MRTTVVFHSGFVERVLILSFDIFGCSGGNLRHQNQHLLKRKMIKFNFSEKAQKFVLMLLSNRGLLGHQELLCWSEFQSELWKHSEAICKYAKFRSEKLETSIRDVGSGETGEGGHTPQNFAPPLLVFPSPRFIADFQTLSIELWGIPV